VRRQIGGGSCASAACGVCAVRRRGATRWSEGCVGGSLRGTVLRAIASPAHTRGTGAHLTCRHPCQRLKEQTMGKYFIAWILGVPAFVLVIAYLIFH
jgi:hypothetical protein